MRVPLTAPVVHEDITDKSMANLEWVTHRMKPADSQPHSRCGYEHPLILVAPGSDVKKIIEASKK
jgi:hypothetical protein